MTSILGWIDQIPYKALNQDTFGTDFIRLGVASVLIDLGELSQEVSQEVRKALPDVPWAGIIGMRHVLAHETVSVDYRKVWDALQDLPRIRELIGAYLEKSCA